MRVWIVAAAIGLASQAQAECDLEDVDLADRHETLAEERGELTAPARSSIGTLRRAAEQLDRNGHPVACAEVVDTVGRLLEDEAVWTDEAPQPEAVGKMNLVTFAATEGPVESAALVGKPLVGSQGHLLGVVEGVLLDQTRDASHLIVRRDGIWNTAVDIAVPSARILVDPDTGELFAEIAAKRLAEAPRYAAEAWDIDANDPWYDAEAAKAVDEAEASAKAARAAEQDASDTAMANDIPPSRKTGAAEDDPAVVQRTPKRPGLPKTDPETAKGSDD